MERLRAFVAGLVFTLVFSAPAAAQAPCPPTLAIDGAAISGGPVCSAPILESQTPDYQDPLATCSGLGNRRVIPVATSAALQQALNNASCGDTIQLAAGSYGSDLTLSMSCPANSPVIVEGAANFASVATGRWTTTGGRNIITGVQFSGSSSGINCRGNNNKVIGNQFAGTAKNAIQLQGQSSSDVACEVAYNEFYDPGSGCSGDAQFNQAIKMNTGGSGQSDTVQRSVWVHHNYFHDWVTSCDQGDLIEIGESGLYDWSQTPLSGLYVEDNLVERYDGGQAASVMDLKAGGGYVVRRNTVRNSGSNRIQNRIGSASVFESNYLTDGADILVNNEDQIVVCNVADEIRIQAGNQQVGELGSGYVRSEDALAASNIGQLIVGFQYNSTHDLPALRTRVEDHTGAITCALEDNTDGACGDAANSTPSYMCAPAVELTASQVGPAAMGRAPVSYLACRRP